MQIYADFMKNYAEFMHVYADFMQNLCRIYAGLCNLCNFFMQFYAILCRFYADFMHFIRVYKMHKYAFYAPGTLLMSVSLPGRLSRGLVTRDSDTGIRVGP